MRTPINTPDLAAKVRQYATLAPLDILSPAEVQADLLALIAPGPLVWLRDGKAAVTLSDFLSSFNEIDDGVSFRDRKAAIKAANSAYAVSSDDDICIDENAMLSDSEEESSGGTFVMAWVWVTDEQIKEAS